MDARCHLPPTFVRQSLLGGLVWSPYELNGAISYAVILSNRFDVLCMGRCGNWNSHAGADTLRSILGIKILLSQLCRTWGHR